ncbi:hypothetical protein BGZ81_010606 [Podila clonocystis]|nr:hypothetical protein BGZ81_010606 [Podila clonocystis]
MPATVPTPSINIISSRGSNTSAASSLNPSSLNGSLRRSSLALGSFHSAQLRRPSFFAPFPYNQSPLQSDLSHSSIHDYSSSPRLGDVYERDLEANYCKNFSCCGLTLGDLHALLQHYEESHVRFENDEDYEDDIFGLGFTDDDGWSTHSESAPNSPQMNKALPTSSCSSSAAEAAAAATMAALAAATSSSFLGKKKSAGVSLSDIYSEESGIPDDAVSAFPNSVLRSTAQAREVAGRKRDLSMYSSSFDAQSPLSKKTAKTSSQSSAALTAASILEDLQAKRASDSSSPTTQDELLATVTGYLEHAISQGMLPNCGEVGSPTYLLAAEDLIRKRDEIVSMMESIGKPGSPGSDKPYRCNIDGCDKAYKNPNGLKYHNQHGHCSVLGANEEDKLNARPYRCTFLDCGKCYKNLNGLKYHIEHSHPNLAAALHAHIPGFATLDGSNVSQAAIAAAAAIAAVQANPVMMAAANAIMASNRQSALASPPSDHTPDSSPNTSPMMGPLRGLDTTLSADVTPMASPTLSRAMLPNLSLSIQTSLAGKGMGMSMGMMTPASLSPTSPTARSPTGSHVSTLTAALAAVTVQREQEQLMQRAL